MRRGNAWWLNQVTTATTPTPVILSPGSLLVLWPPEVRLLQGLSRHEGRNAWKPTCRAVLLSSHGAWMKGPDCPTMINIQEILFGFFSSQSHWVPVPCYVFSLALTRCSVGCWSELKAFLCLFDSAPCCIAPTELMREKSGPWIDIRMILREWMCCLSSQEISPRDWVEQECLTPDLDPGGACRRLSSPLGLRLEPLALFLCHRRAWVYEWAM